MAVEEFDYVGSQVLLFGLQVETVGCAFDDDEAGGDFGGLEAVVQNL